MTSGIYKITNTSNGNTYIGSAINLSNRWSVHRNELSNNKHKNKHLQSAYNKYGKDSFIFTVITTCTKDLLLGLEQHYIDICNPEYNILKIAGSSVGVHCSEETKKKIGDANRGRAYHQDEEYRKKLSESGVKSWDKRGRCVIDSKNPKEYIKEYRKTKKYKDWIKKYRSTEEYKKKAASYRKKYNNKRGGI